MKKILLISLAILLISGGIAYAISPPSPGTGEIVQRGYPSDPPKRFRLVRYLGTDLNTTLVTESIVIWNTTVDDGVTIITTTTSGDSRVAGIIAGQALTQDTVGNTAVQDIGKDNWTWLQTYGLAEVRVDANVGAVVGAALGTGTTAGEATAFNPVAGAAALGGVLTTRQGNAGFWMDAGTAAANNAEVFLKCE